LAYGTVTWFDPQRGVGVIRMDGEGHDVVVQSTDIDGGGLQSLRAADSVAFTLLNGPGGMGREGLDAVTPRHRPIPRGSSEPAT